MRLSNYQFLMSQIDAQYVQTFQTHELQCLHIILIAPNTNSNHIRNQSGRYIQQKTFYVIFYYLFMQSSPCQQSDHLSFALSRSKNLSLYPHHYQNHAHSLCLNRNAPHHMIEPDLRRDTLFAQILQQIQLQIIILPMHCSMRVWVDACVFKQQIAAMEGNYNVQEGLTYFFYYLLFMKAILLLLVLLTFTSQLKLNIDSSIVLQPGQNTKIPLVCEGARGEVSFGAKGLPKGLELRGNVIEGTAGAVFGYFPVLIDARDISGNSISQIMVMRVLDTPVSGGQSGSAQSITFTPLQNQATSGSSAIFQNGGSSNSQLQNQGPNQNQNQNPAQNSNQNPNSQGLGQPNQPSSPSSNNLNSLLDMFAPVSPTNPNIGGYNPSTPASQQTYPTPASPTGVPEGTPTNMIPRLINDAKAPRLPSDKNVITSDSVKVNAIFQRQLNSNKAIANLLDIIDQLRANTNAAKADMPNLEAQLKEAMLVQRNTQAKILQAENQRSRLNTAITNLNDNINQLRKQLADLQGSFSDKTQTIRIKTEQQKTYEGSVATYENEIRNVNSDIAARQKAISNIDGSIKVSAVEIQDLGAVLESKKKEVVNIDEKIATAVRNVQFIDDEIMDLKNRLNAAAGRKAQAELEQAQFRNLKANSPAVIRDLEDQIRKANQKLSDLRAERAKESATLDQFMKSLSDLETGLNKAKQQLVKIQKQITALGTNGSALDGQISKKNQQINNALGNLQFLKSQVNSYELALRSSYNEGNDANTKVNIARQNLDAMVKRYEKEMQSLAEANLNLEKARAEKQLADIAMEELLRERSSALPYSIVPNGNGVSTAGTPTGNNPRGSPLGPLVVNNPSNNPNAYAQASSQITDYSNYLSSAYANGVDPTRPETLTQSYPFSVYRPLGAQLRNQATLVPITGPDGTPLVGVSNVDGVPSYTGDFSCSSAPNALINGLITQVGNNVVTIKGSDQKEYVARIGSCTQASADRKNYTMSVGDQIQFSGQKTGNQVLNVYQARCKCTKCQ